MLAYVLGWQPQPRPRISKENARSYNELNQMMLHLVIRGRGWYLFPRLNRFPTCKWFLLWHYTASIYLFPCIYSSPCFPKFTAYKTSICFETTQYVSFTEPLLIHEYKKSLLCIYCSISSCKLYNKILLKLNWAVNCCTFVFHPSCNIVYSSVQNLSFNIIHSRGQKSILH